jgi:hypothetical protein
MLFECDRSFFPGHPSFIRSAPCKKAGGPERVKILDSWLSMKFVTKDDLVIGLWTRCIPVFRPTIGNVKENCR